jgi:hypothetical protein
MLNLSVTHEIHSMQFHSTSDDNITNDANGSRLIINRPKQYLTHLHTLYHLKKYDPQQIPTLTPKTKKQKIENNQQTSTTIPKRLTNIFSASCHPRSIPIQNEQTQEQIKLLYEYQKSREKLSSVPRLFNNLHSKLWSKQHEPSLNETAPAGTTPFGFHQGKK